MLSSTKDLFRAKENKTLITIYIKADEGEELGKDFSNTDGEERGIVIKGHADYAEKGKDIVCAAVSTIFQVMALGLIKLAEQYPDHIQVKGVKEK